MREERCLARLQDAVDELVAQYVSPDSPGMAVLLAYSGEVLLQRGYGMADVEERVPVTAGTRFIIASVTKQFTAAGVMLLGIRGAIDYDEPISCFFPDFPGWTKRVTVRHLLTHTSGIPDYLGADFWKEARESDFTLTEVLDRIAHYDELEFAPGDSFSYTNSGYVLLGPIVEAASGLPFSRYMDESIFAPLGMRNTVVGEQASPYPGQATGYYREEDNGELVRAPYNLSVVGWADGNIISTVGDLLRWDRSLYSRQLLSGAALCEALTPVRQDDPSFSRYGFGWMLNERRGVPEVWHAGSTVGYNAWLGHYPEQRATIAVLSNSAEVDPHGVFIGALAELLLADDMEPVPAPIAVEDGELRKMVGVYVPALATARQMGNLVLEMNDSGRLTTAVDSDMFAGLSLVPVCEDQFRIDNSADHYVHFLRCSESNAVTGLRYCGNGMVHNFVRM